MRSRQPKFYFSFRSPYSWIAARLVQERFPFSQFSLDYIPYWEPEDATRALLRAAGGEFLYTPMPRSRQLYILQDVKRIVRRLRYRWVWPVDRDQPRWELTHLGYLYARHHGKGEEFFRAVSQARWEEGRDITDAGVLRQVGEHLRLDPEALVGAVRDPSILMEAVGHLYAAYEDGVFGVPFFVVGYEKFWGQDRFDEFLLELQRNGPRASLHPADGGPPPAHEAQGAERTRAAPVSASQTQDRTNH